jgi:hypothetical protein
MDNNKIFSATQLRLIKNKYCLKHKPKSLSQQFMTSPFETINTEIKYSDEKILPSIKTITERFKDNVDLSSRNDIRKNRVLNSDRIANTREELDVLRCNTWNKNYKLEFDWEYMKKRYMEVEIADRKKAFQDKLVNSQSDSDLIAKFYKKIDQENAAVFIRNINLSKENFKFEQFNYENYDNVDDINAKEIIKIGNKVTFRDRKELNQVDDILKKYYKLKMHGEYSKLTSIEYYRNVIKEKEELEAIYKRE